MPAFDVYAAQEASESSSSGSKRSRVDISATSAGGSSSSHQSQATGGESQLTQQHSDATSLGDSSSVIPTVLAVAAPAKPRPKKRVGGISLNPSNRCGMWKVCCAALFCSVNVNYCCVVLLCCVELLCCAIGLCYCA